MCVFAHNKERVSLERYTKHTSVFSIFFHHAYVFTSVVRNEKVIKNAMKRIMLQDKLVHICVVLLTDRVSYLISLSLSFLLWR